MDTGELDIGSYNVNKQTKGQESGLNELFEKMQIAVVGREGEKGVSESPSEEDDDSESEIDDIDE